MIPISSPALLALPSRDRRCRGWTLDNWLRRWWAPARAEVDLLSIRPGQAVVDLGAGVGYLAATLLDRVGPTGTLVMVDPDAKNLSLARSRWSNDRRVRLIEASATNVPCVVDSTVDCVVLSLVLCCLVDKKGVLDETWRILRPGGLALVSYPERGARLSARRASLRVSPDLWAQLLLLHPWKVISSDRKRLIRRHVLEKPVEAVRPGNGGRTVN